MPKNTAPTNNPLQDRLAVLRKDAAKQSQTQSLFDALRDHVAAAVRAEAQAGPTHRLAVLDVTALLGLGTPLAVIGLAVAAGEGHLSGGYKQRAVRHVAIARHHIAASAKEPGHQPIKLGELKFPDAVEALDAGFSLTEVYNAVKKPAPARGKRPKATFADAVAAWLDRPGIPYRGAPVPGVKRARILIFRPGSSEEDTLQGIVALQKTLPQSTTSKIA